MVQVELGRLHLSWCGKSGSEEGSKCLMAWLKSQGGGRVSLEELGEHALLTIPFPGRATVVARCRVRGCYSYVEIQSRQLVGVERCPECQGLGYFPESHNGNYCGTCGITGFRGGADALGVKIQKP